MEPNNNLRTTVVEIEILNTGVTSFNLGELADLRDAKNIISIEAFNVTQIPISPGAKTVVNAAVFAKSFIKLIRGNTELRTLPLYSISKQVNGTVIPQLNVGNIDPQKSKIVMGTNAGLVINEVFLLSVTYEK